MINQISHETRVYLAKNEIVKTDTYKETRKSYIKKESKNLALKRNISQAAAKEIVEKSINETAVLDPDFILYLADGGEVTVGEALSNKARYDKARLLDPVEPEYQDCKQVAILYLFGEPKIKSFAHGGRDFSLSAIRSTVMHVGGYAVEVVKECAAIAREKGFAYLRGDEIVFPQSDGRLIPGDKSVTSFIFAYYVQIKIDKGKKLGIVPIDMPTDIERHINSNACQLDLDPLKAVITAPTLRSDWSVIDKQGYDKKSRFLYIQPDYADSSITIQENPDTGDAIAALERLLFPFKKFPFAGDVDNSVLVAALLTATIRDILPTAPGFLFTASSPGSGKTLLAQSIAALCGETEPTVMTADPNDDVEFRKVLLASLRQGKKIILLDNCIGGLKSKTLAQLLTSEKINDRVLGKTQMIDVSTSALVIVTGNNIQIYGDLTRRFLTININPEMEKPWTREFDLNPLEYIKANRQQMVADALTILRAYWTVTRGRRFGPGRTASFEQWDDMVRQTICWLVDVSKSRDLPVGLSDPVLSIEAAIEEDPARNRLKILLKVWPLIFSAPASVAGLKLMAGDDEGDGFTEDTRILYEVLIEIAGERGTINSKMLAHFLSRSKNIIVEGLMLKKAGETATGKMLWTVVKVH